jgi:hypothetical protein
MRNILSHTSKKSGLEVLPHLKSIMAFKTSESRRKGIRPEPWCKNLDMNREGESY